MARARNVTHDEALIAAEILFWRDGYEGVGTRQIEEETGLTRFTLQREYGGKKAFFLATLDKYLETKIAQLLPVPAQNALPALIAWIGWFGDTEEINGGCQKGCLLRTAITEFSRGDTEVDQRIDSYFRAMHMRFAEVLAVGVARGETQPDLDPETSAGLLVAALLGVSVMKQAHVVATPDNVLRKGIPDLIMGWAR